MPAFVIALTTQPAAAYQKTRLRLRQAKSPREFWAAAQLLSQSFPADEAKPALANLPSLCAPALDAHVFCAPLASNAPLIAVAETACGETEDLQMAGIAQALTPFRIHAFERRNDWYCAGPWMTCPFNLVEPASSASSRQNDSAFSRQVFLAQLREAAGAAEAGKTVAFVQNVAVSPGCRRQGIARELVDWCERRATQVSAQGAAS
eukprot:4406537-Pleurochrysis_carterae.AAC.1